jgi:transposase
MMQSLLEDRFKLVVHREVRQTSVFRLSLADQDKTGLQLQPHSREIPCSEDSNAVPLHTGPAATDSAANLLGKWPLICNEGDEIWSPRRNLVSLLWSEWKNLEQQIVAMNLEVEQIASSDPACQRLRQIPGIGPLVATAIVAAIGNGAAFHKGREFSAWLGLVPRQHSTGGQARLFGISKRGNCYLRKLLVHGARSPEY